MDDLRPKRREVAPLVDRRPAHVAVEIAIGAFRQAEGPMDIDPEAGIGVADGRAAFAGLGAYPVPNHRLLMPANALIRQPPCPGRAGERRQSASSPVSPVRMRWAPSIGVTKILPSPIRSSASRTSSSLNGLMTAIMSFMSPCRIFALDRPAMFVSEATSPVDDHDLTVMHGMAA